MKKNLYYRTMYKRSNVFKSFSVNVFQFLASYPRLLLEVFIRRNLGERYFTFFGSIVMAFILAVLPLFLTGVIGLFGRTRSFEFTSFITGNLTWYVFLAAFVFFALKRREEIKRNPSVFDFGRFSLSSGEHHPLFYQIKRGGIPPNPRTVETLLEPLFFFIIGLVLVLFGQLVGWLILVCSVLYGLSYRGAYKLGDDFVMDKIDEQIANEETFNAFVADQEPRLTRGMRFYGRRPVDPEKRKKVADSFIEEDKDTFVAS
jgi:hypothetical protein